MNLQNTSLFICTFSRASWFLKLPKSAIEGYVSGTSLTLLSSSPLNHVDTLGTKRK
jgi:hypothetical protein